jgi:hypothetical protein
MIVPQNRRARERMTGLHSASSHRRVKPVHRVRAAAWGVVLLAACGPSSAGGEGDGNGTGDETGEPADFLWTFGGDDRPILSWPVSDDAGNLFVLVGEGASPSAAYPDALDLDAVSLVSLDDKGAERWTVQVGGATTTGLREAPVRPIVGAGGDAWVHVGEELRRISSDGTAMWLLESLPDPDGYGTDPATWTSLQAALDSSGVYYALPRMSNADEEQQQLRAIGSDGTELWRFDPGTPGYSGADFGLIPTQTDAPLIGPDGRVLLGCDTCIDGQVGIAVFDGDSGQPSMLLSAPGQPPAKFRQLLWDGSAAWIDISGAVDANGLWTLAPDGATTEPDHTIQLVADSGAVWTDAEFTSEPSFVLHWGDDDITVTPPPERLGGEFRGATPIAVLEPEAVLLETHVRIPALDDGPSESDNGLLLVDKAGSVFWYRGGMFRERQPVPAIGDGFIAYIEAGTQRLVAIEAPVEGLADGPWPIVGGDPQGTRSAEGK